MDVKVATGESAGERPSQGDAPRFVSESIRLAQGWTGRVLTHVERPACDAAPSGALPTDALWRRLLGPLLADPASMPGYAVLKYSKRREVFRARLAWERAGLEVVCRRSRAQGWRRKLAGRCGVSRVRSTFDQALTLLRAGINTALPLAWVERGRPVPEAWIITEFVGDLVDLDQAALTLCGRIGGGRLRSAKAAIREAIVELVDRLERCGAYHRDFKASNLLLAGWEGDGGPVCIWLVDLEGIGRGVLMAASRRWRPLVRLAASLAGYASITRTDYCRFLQAYLARAGLPRDTWKPRFRRLARQAEHYVRRAKRRKVGKLDGYAGGR